MKECGEYCCPACENCIYFYELWCELLKVKVFYGDCCDEFTCFNADEK